MSTQPTAKFITKDCEKIRLHCIMFGIDVNKDLYDVKIIIIIEKIIKIIEFSL